MQGRTRLYAVMNAIAVLLMVGSLAHADSRSDDRTYGRNAQVESVQLGPRPFFLVSDMDEDTVREARLKQRLQQCAAGPFSKTDFSIGHRGAPLQFAEHTRESYEAAARMGAGILECDVAFTKDKELVCRHSQCDLHTTTNILQTQLANKCAVPPQFNAAGELINAAEVRCCTSDITLAEFKTLKGKMDGANKQARSIEEYMRGTADWRTDLYADRGTLMTHAESIELFKALGVKMTPELKAPAVPMPFDGFTQEAYAQKLIDEYKAARVPPRDVFAQSFNLDDVLYWVNNEPEFGAQAVYLDGRYGDPAFDHTDPETWSPDMEQLRASGVNIIAPPMWMLLASNKGAGGDVPAEIVPSVYAEHARQAGLDIITWTFERSAPLVKDGAWYHQTTDDVVNNDGDKYLTLDVLAQDVGIRGIFSDWPATVTYYANCTGLN